jgi:acyl-CoA hydrolase
MEVGVRVEAEDMLTGKVAHVSSAYLVFVGIDDHGKAVPLPPVVAQTPDEKRRMAAAEERRRDRQRRAGTT